MPGQVKSACWWRDYQLYCTRTSTNHQMRQNPDNPTPALTYTLRHIFRIFHREIIGLNESFHLIHVAS